MRGRKASFFLVYWAYFANPVCYTSWEKALANGKSVADDCKSEGSHSQRRGIYGHKPDIRLNSDGQASDPWTATAPKLTVIAYSKSSIPRR